MDTGQNLEIDIEKCVLNSEDEQSNHFEKELKNLPELNAFVQRLYDCIYRQRDLLHKLYAKLKEQNNLKLIKLEKSTQTTNENLWNQPIENSANITEQIKEVAENAMQQTGFVYEATSGMYYDYNTGYYYNAELGLYYDGNKGCYYFFDKVSSTFHFHSQVDCSNQGTSHDSEIKSIEDTAKRKNILDGGLENPKRKKVYNKEGLEDGECSDSDEENNEQKINDVQDSEVIVSKKSIVENVHEEPFTDESSQAWPPCLRITVQETDVKGLNVGTLFLVTCTGGTMGRQGDHAVTISDINISKHHAKFSFCENDGLYKIIDLGSRNGTYLDGERMSVALRESEPMALKHGSVIRVGSTSLLCHIHTGRETCEQCEPGCTQADTRNHLVEESLESKEEKRKLELKKLRKRFGLDKLSYKEAVVSLAPGYQDRAESRRKTVGSSDQSEKTQVASVHEPIQSENKGFKMLSKMGWNKGQSLGKDASKGVTEPVLVEQRADRAGLGSSESGQQAVDPKTKQKTEIWRKTKKRFQDLE
uniref:Angiogenic factor with G patch and FHA domains 1 n=1 Tax=Clastoptera arizonana TaxID=38151 RepID=A0A1B6DKM8_9HEMI